MRSNLMGRSRNPSLTAKFPLHAFWLLFLIWSEMSSDLTPLTVSRRDQSKPKAGWLPGRASLGKG